MYGLEVNMNPQGPNLPGHVIDKNSWIYRSSQGFSKGSRPGSASQNRRDPSLQDIKNVFNPPPAAKSLPRPSTAGAKRGPAVGQSLLNLLGESAPDLLKQPQTGNNKFGPASPKPGVKLGPPVVPAHILNEKQVLRFYGQFTEDRTWDTEGPLGVPKVEATIVRNLSIFFYLEDETILMTEGHGSNGMSGGTFFKRAALKKRDGSFYTAEDFSIGNVIDALGQSILIYDVDGNTRDYFRKVLKTILPPALQVAEKGRDDLGVAMATGSGTHKTEKHDPNGSFKTRSSDYEAKREALDKSHAFFNAEARVLRFEAILSSNEQHATIADKILGSAKKYSVCYFLNDNTMDIRIVKDKRSTYDEVTSILKKAKLAKNWRDVQKGKAPEYYQPADLICGNVVECYGRYLLLIDCDPFTRGMYESMGVAQRQVPLVSPNDRTVVHPIPQLGDGFLAIGSDEDTLGTVHGMPKPGKDLSNLQRNQGRTLRCKTALISDKEVDKQRNFMITYYMEDDSLQIYEEIVRNSGLAGGNFLKRGRYLNGLPQDSEVPRYFKAVDFYLGNVFSVNGTEMRITEMDNMSLRFCESYPDEFPMFDTFQIVEHLLNKVTSSRMDVKGHMAKYDRKKAHYLSKDLFVHTLDELQITVALNDQELLTVMRRFQEDDKFYYEELSDLFSHVYYTKNVGTGNKRRPSQSSPRGDEIEKSAFLGSLRGNKTQLRRLFRKDVHAVDGYITLLQLDKLVKRYGVKLSEQNKVMITKYYALNQREAALLLPRLNEPHELDVLEGMNIDSGAIPQSLGSSNSRLDIRSSARLTGTAGAAALSIQSRRQQISKSVLRKPQAEAPIFVESEEVNHRSNIAISYHKFCDDIYRSDWL